MSDGRPNVLIVYPDQMRFDVMGCVGHPVVKTPNIDRVASQGVRFDHSIYVLSTLLSISGVGDDGKVCAFERDVCESLSDSAGSDVYGGGVSRPWISDGLCGQVAPGRGNQARVCAERATAGF